MARRYKSMTGEEFVEKLLADERDFSGIRLKDGFDLSGHPAFGELNEHFAKRTQHYVSPNMVSYWEQPISLDGSRFIGLVARGLKLPVLCAEDTHLDKADFTGADLRGACLEHARLYDVVFNDADLGVITSNTNQGYKKTNLRFARFCRTKSNGTKFYGADFHNADMSCSEFRGAVFTNADLNFANAQQSDFREADFSHMCTFGTNFQLADLRGVKGLDALTKGSNLPFTLFLGTKVDSNATALSIENRARGEGAGFFVVEEAKDPESKTQ